VRLGGGGEKKKTTKIRRKRKGNVTHPYSGDTERENLQAPTLARKVLKKLKKPYRKAVGPNLKGERKRERRQGGAPEEKRNKGSHAQGGAVASSTPRKIKRGEKTAPVRPMVAVSQKAENAKNRVRSN